MIFSISSLQPESINESRISKNMEASLTHKIEVAISTSSSYASRIDFRRSSLNSAGMSGMKSRTSPTLFQNTNQFKLKDSFSRDLTYESITLILSLAMVMGPEISSSTLSKLDRTPADWISVTNFFMASPGVRELIWKSSNVRFNFYFLVTRADTLKIFASLE